MAVSILMTYCKALDYLQHVPKLNTLPRTLHLAAGRLIPFTLCLFIVLLAFSLAMSMAFGTTCARPPRTRLVGSGASSLATPRAWSAPPTREAASGAA